MIKITYFEAGKPAVGIGIEANDFKSLTEDKKIFTFQIGGQLVSVGYVESVEKLQEKLKINEMKLTQAGQLSVESKSQEKIS